MSEAVKAKIAQSCTRHLTPDRLLRVACAAVSRQPKLADCTPASLYLALANCGQLGLEPNLLGSAYLVPFKRSIKSPDGKWSSVMEAQFIPGYRGLIELARRSGEIQTISAHVVREKDDFSYAVGERPIHRPYLGEDDPGKMRLAWAIATFKDGGFQVEVMTRREIDSIRGRSKAKDDGPWVTDYEEMARKTVVRRLCKYLPLTIELADAVAADTAFEIGGAIDVEHSTIAETTAPVETATDRLANKLKAAENKAEYNRRKKQ
jgi:recombination protein RecT